MSKKIKMIPYNPYLGRLQRRHFILFDVLPFGGTLFALGLLFVRPITTTDIALFVMMWLITGLGLTVGFHRLFSHRSFETGNAMASLLIVMGSMAARGPMMSWVNIHRRHHETADREGDPHSPVVTGQAWRERFWGWVHSHITWIAAHDYPNPTHYVPDLVKNQPLRRQNRRYYVWVALGLLLPTAIGGFVEQSWMGAATGFLWGGAVRLFVVAQAWAWVTSFAHIFGSRPFDLADDQARNSALASLFTWGEGWHNNHHAFPYSASFGLRWYRFDLGYWVIRACELLGLVWNVRVPTAERIAAEKSALGNSKQFTPSALQER